MKNKELHTLLHGGQGRMPKDLEDDAFGIGVCCWMFIVLATVTIVLSLFLEGCATHLPRSIGG